MTNALDQAFKAALEAYNIPQHIRDGIQRYVQEGIPTGGFLRAVFTDNLHDAVCRADEESLRSLEHIVKFIWTECPVACYGSNQNYENWIERARTFRTQRLLEIKDIVHANSSESKTVYGEFGARIYCPVHPDAAVEIGYGLAGGGIGSYAYCTECDQILVKVNESKSAESE